MKLESLNLLAALPEIVLLVAACVVLLIDAIVPQAKRISTAGLTLLAMIPSAAIIIAQFGQPTQYAFSNMYVADSLAHLLKLCSFIALAVTLIYAGQYVRDRGMERGEFYALALFSLLGQMVMISANHLLIVYLGLELMSLSLYALAALRRDAPASSEAAMKYFVLGALASARFAEGQVNRIVFSFGVVFIVAGLAFKFGAVPFHMWVPDVYQGSPTAATLLIAAGPKLAAFAITFRVLVEGLSGVATDWQQMLMVLAVASLAIGNIVAIRRSRRSVSCSWACWPASWTARSRTPPAPTARRCSTSSPMC